MPVSLYGNVKYASVLGPSLSDRTAWDGTVPKCFSCSVNPSFLNGTDAADTRETIFALTGVPADAGYALDSADVRRNLVSQSNYRLRDAWIVLEGEPSVSGGDFSGDVTITLSVCDATADFPSAANTMFLYQCSLHLTADYSSRTVHIPDVDGLIVAAGMNVCCRIRADVGARSWLVANFHAVSIVDD